MRALKTIAKLALVIAWVLLCMYVFYIAVIMWFVGYTFYATMAALTLLALLVVMWAAGRES